MTSEVRLLTLILIGYINLLAIETSLGLGNLCSSWYYFVLVL